MRWIRYRPASLRRWTTWLSWWYRGALLDSCTSESQVVQEVLITVVHEIAHHFGIAEARLHELGWG